MNRFSPRAEFHQEQDPSIDNLIRWCARRIEAGMSKEDVLSDLVDSFNLEPPAAANAVEAGAILAVKPHE